MIHLKQTSDVHCLVSEKPPGFWFYSSHIDKHGSKTGRNRMFPPYSRKRRGDGKRSFTSACSDSNNWSPLFIYSLLARFSSNFCCLKLNEVLKTQSVIRSDKIIEILLSSLSLCRQKLILFIGEHHLLLQLALDTIFILFIGLTDNLLRPIGRLPTSLTNI